ncbi:MAG: Asp23/Gls24 family envelope stress response protein [Desulfitobacteriaceae bacterium]
MKIIALVGSSGSGKSHRAIAIAYETNSDLVIDDGLLIQGGRIIDGISSKNQPTKVGAIKTALFTDLEHRKQAQETLRALLPQKILILGTSVAMVEKITERLALPKPDKITYIEEVASPEEISTAKYYRNHFGKHVIPAPTLEVKSNFPNSLIEALQVILHRQDPAKQKVFEQSVIRPTFSYLGNITIADKVLNDLIKWVLATFPSVRYAEKVRVVSEHGNTIISIEYSANYGQPLYVLSRDIQTKVKEVIENHTSFNVIAIDILVTKVVRK